ncbi:MAG: hypothetical protein ACO307_15060 [Ilumatobacteraceae bacterium]
MSDIVVPAVSAGVWSTPLVVVLIAVSAILLSRITRHATARVRTHQTAHGWRVAGSPGGWRAG